MRLLYSLIYALALLFVFPFQYKKRPANIRKRWLDEKMGRFPSNISGPCVWVHAVSVGEVLAAVTFIKSLKDKHPTLKVMVSTMTDTGQNVARERLSDLAEVVYMPFDLAYIMRRAIATTKPLLFVVMETELWPSSIWSMHKADIPIVMLNGRISDSSYRGYGRIKLFMGDVLQHVNVFCMQDEEYAKRIIKLGAPQHRVKVTGSFKFDLNLAGTKPEWGENLKGHVVVAGSTHGGEEELIFGIYEKLKAEFRDLNLIIAPRHPERFDEVEDILKVKSLQYVRKTKMEAEEISGTVVLLDTIGELSSVYSLADIAIMGGSFIEHGGQNPLEPAYWGKPVVCGPHMENFPFIEDFYSSGAAMMATRETLLDTLRDLITSSEKRQSMGSVANDLMEQNRGAVNRAIDVVERYLKT